MSLRNNLNPEKSKDLREMGFYKIKQKEKKREVDRTGKLLKKRERVGISKLSEYLRHRTPASERWFQREWKTRGMLDDQDLFNWKHGPFIPDCFNSKFRYVIEVDGSIHSLQSVRQNDERKERFFVERGFSVFRVKAFDFMSLGSVIDQVRLIRQGLKAT